MFIFFMFKAKHLSAKFFQYGNIQNTHLINLFMINFILKINCKDLMPNSILILAYFLCIVYSLKHITWYFIIRENIKDIKV